MHVPPTLMDLKGLISREFASVTSILTYLVINYNESLPLPLSQYQPLLLELEYLLHDDFSYLLKIDYFQLPLQRIYPAFEFFLIKFVLSSFFRQCFAYFFAISRVMRWDLGMKTIFYFF